MTTRLLNNPNRRPFRGGGSSRAFTLLEILVVLVLLLIGILSILRLFPIGFLTIKRTGEATEAQALVKQQLDSQRNLNSICDSIMAVAPDVNGKLQVLADVAPDNLTEMTTEEAQLLGIPTNLDFYFLSNINRVRYIIGEVVRIPVPSPNAAKGYGSVYMLQFGPVYNDPKAPDNIQVYGQALERTEQDSTSPAPPTLNSPSQYAIDYDKMGIAFTPRVKDGGGSRQFLARYDYYAATGNTLPTVKSVLNAVIVVPDIPTTDPTAQDPQPIWQPFFDNAQNKQPTDFVAFKRDSDQVSRKFLPAVQSQPGAAPTWSNDPYEFAWYSEQQASNANPGVLLFNPIGHDYLETTSTGTQPLTARVDYATFDNHIVREDRTVPTQTPYEIKLAVPFILTNGDILNDQTNYYGMFRDMSKVANPDLLIYNVNTGDKIGEYKNGAGSGVGIGANFTLNTKTGTIRLDKAAVENNKLQNATIRIFYRAQGDWGMQVQKAQAHYTREFAPASVTYKHYYYPPTTSDPGQGRRIYFRNCEAGKMVVLGEYFVKDKNGKVLRFANEAYHINANAALNEPLNGTQFTWIDLSEQHPEAQTDDWRLTDEPTGQAVASIQGASIKSRVIWKSSERWRKIDNDTFLLQTPNR